MELYITIGAYVLLFLFLIWGFMWGAIRGIKRSLLRFVLFIVFVIIAGAISPLITNALVGLQLPFDGTNMQTIAQFLKSLITKNPEFNGILEASPALGAAIEKLPIVVVNIVVFIIVMLLLKLVSWIIYKIFAAIYLKTKIEDETTGEETKVKKHWLAGGLLGAVQGFILMFAIFFPINGLTTTYAKIANEVYPGGEKTPASELIEQNVPKEVSTILNAYNNSPMVIVTNLFGLSDVCFDAITTTKLNDENFTLRNEVFAVAEIYNSAEYFFTIDFNAPDFTYASLDFDKIEKLFDVALNSSIVKNVMPELAVSYIGKINDLDYVTQSEYKDSLISFVNKLKIDLENNGTLTKNFKTEMKSILSIAKTLAKNGILDQLTSKNINITEVLDILKQNENAPISEIIGSVYNSNLMKTLISEGVNLGLDVLGQYLGTPIEGRVDKNNMDWLKIKDDTVTFTNSVLALTNTIDPSNSNIQNLTLNQMITLLEEGGILLDMLKDSPMFKSSSSDIYLEVLIALSASSFGEYFDFTALVGNGVWENQGKTIAKLLKVVDNFSGTDIKTIDFRNVDYNYFKNLAGSLTTLESVSALKPKLLDFALEKLTQSTGSLSEIIVEFINGIDRENISLSLKNNLNGFIDFAEVFGKTGTINILFGEKFTPYSLLNAYNEYGKERINSAFINMVEQKSIQNILVYLVNNNLTKDDVNFGTVTNVDFVKVKTDLSLIVDDIFKISEQILQLDSAEIEAQPLLIAKADTDLIIDSLNEIVITLRNIGFFIDENSNSAFDSLLKTLKLEKLAGPDTLTTLFTSLKEPIKTIKNSGALNHLNSTEGYQLSQDKIYTMLETFAKNINTDITIQSVILPLLNSDFLVDELINKGIDSVMTTTAADYIDLMPLKADKTKWNTEVDYLADVITRLATGKIEGKSYLRYILEGGNAEKFLTGLTTEDVTVDGVTIANDVDTLLLPVLSSEIFKPMVSTLFNTISSSINIAGVQIPDASGYDLNAQGTEITAVIKSFLKIYPSLTGGLDYETLDKQLLSAVMENLKVNAYRKELAPAGTDTSLWQDGIFKSLFDGIIDYLKTDVNIGENISKFLNEYEHIYDVDFSNLFALVEAAKSSNGNITPELKSSMAQVLTDMNKPTEVVEISIDLMDASDKLKNLSGDLTPIEEVLTMLSGYSETKKAKLDETIDMLVRLTGFNEFSEIKGIDLTANLALVQSIKALQQAENITLEAVKSVIDKTVGAELIVNKAASASITFDTPAEIKSTVSSYIDSTALSIEAKTNLKTIFKV